MKFQESKAGPTTAAIGQNEMRVDVAPINQQQPLLEVRKGGITKEKVDAVVNAANTSLLGGGGVDGAIHQAGGPAIMEACTEIRQERGGIATGEAVLTTAGELPARFVIHTAGPVWHGGKSGELRLLAKCYRNSLLLADRHMLKSIAFSNISTGVYGLPKEKAAEVALKTVRKYLSEKTTSLEKISFICYDEENYQLYRQLLL